MNSFQIDNFSLDETWNSDVYHGNIWAAVLRFIPLENRRSTDSQFDFPLKYGTTYRIGQFMSCLNSISPSDNVPQISDIQAELTISDYIDENNHPFFFIMSHHPGKVKISKRISGRAFPLKPNIQYQVFPGDFIRFKEFVCVIYVDEGGELENSPSSSLNTATSSNASTHFTIGRRRSLNDFNPNLFIEPETQSDKTKKSFSSPVNNTSFGESVYFSPQQENHFIFHSTQLSQSIKYPNMDETIYFSPQMDSSFQLESDENQEKYETKEDKNKKGEMNESIKVKDENQVNIKENHDITTNPEKEEIDGRDDLIGDFESIINDIRSLEIRNKETEDLKSSELISKSQKSENISNKMVDIQRDVLTESNKKKIKTRQKQNTPMIMLTGFNKQEVATYSRIIKKLKGKIVTNAEACTHLVCHKPHRTLKMLTAIHYCNYVLSTDWLNESNKHGYFVNEKDYWYRDEEFITNYKVDFEEILKNRIEKKGNLIFKGMDFFITPNVNNYKHLKTIIKSGGGNVMNTLSNKDNNMIIVVASDEEVSNFKGNNQYKYVYDEFVYESSIRQRISWENEVNIRGIEEK